MFNNMIDNISKVDVFYNDEHLKIKYHTCFNEDKELISYFNSLESLLDELNIDKEAKLLFVNLNYNSYENNSHVGYFECFLSNNIQLNIPEVMYELLYEFVSSILDYIKLNYDINNLINK